MLKLNHYKYIIWDWNGTLINDVCLSCELINELLIERNLKAISLEKYREVYCHPVQGIYEQLGFDLEKEPFRKISDKWHAEYLERFDELSLFPDSVLALESFKSLGCTQLILSALPHDLLIRSVYKRGVDSYFAEILGLEDNLGRSKLENGRSLISRYAINPREALLIGDTGHDAEVAKKLDLSCILVARGAESKNRLLGYDCSVFEDFSSLLKSAHSSTQSSISMCHRWQDRPEVRE